MRLIETRLIEQFRVLGPNGLQHTVAWYQDHYAGIGGQGFGLESIDTVRRYCLKDGQDVQRVDEDTFLTAEGAVLRRVVGRRSAVVDRS